MTRAAWAVRGKDGSEDPPVQRLGDSCRAKAAALSGRGEELQKRERPGGGGMSGWDATKAWYRVAWILITVNNYYLLDIIRMRLAEVERFEGVGGSFVVR